jgi:hypothetical protein
MHVCMRINICASITKSCVIHNSSLMVEAHTASKPENSLHTDMVDDQIEHSVIIKALSII